MTFTRLTSTDVNDIHSSDRYADVVPLRSALVASSAGNCPMITRPAPDRGSPGGSRPLFYAPETPGLGHTGPSSAASLAFRGPVLEGKRHPVRCLNRLAEWIGRRPFAGERPGG